MRGTAFFEEYFEKVIRKVILRPLVSFLNIFYGKKCSKTIFKDCDPEVKKIFKT